MTTSVTESIPSHRKVRFGRAITAAAAIPVISRPAAPSHTSDPRAATITGVPAIRSASRKSVSWNALPPKMSPIASWWSPSRTAATPLEISGSAVAAARMVAPNTAPCIPHRPASSLPEDWSATPAASVTADASPKRPTTYAVERFTYGRLSFACGSRLCRRPGRPPGMSTFQSPCSRTRFTIQRPPSQKTTAAIDAGLTPPRLVEAGSAAPPSTVASTTITISASRTGISEPTRKLSGRSLPAERSSRTRTSVWIAMPPIRLPTARSRCPAMHADVTIAISGSVPAIASRISPPSASPRSKRRSSESVVFERKTPAAQVAPEPATKITTRSAVDTPPTRLAYDAVIPRELTTERLLLRQWRDGDADALYEIYVQPEYLETMTPLDLEGTRAQVARFRQRWAD